MLFTDEWGGGSRPRCRASDPLDWGADAFYDIVDGKLVERGYFKMPAPQSPEENCVAHNGSIIPVPGRDIFVQAWYQGGVSVVDFTDSSNPVEIAFFDRGPVNGEGLTMGGYWSTYWYDGRIYGTEIARGLDVFELLPSEHLSENEIAAAGAAIDGDLFNPQTQTRLDWPHTPVVARAYADQLSRSETLSAEQGEALTAALDRIEAEQTGSKLIDVSQRWLTSSVSSRAGTKAPRASAWLRWPTRCVASPKARNKAGRRVECASPARNCAGQQSRLPRRGGK